MEMERERICSFTGHRPDKLPWGSCEKDRRCTALKGRIVQELKLAYEDGFRHFICGMARGADLYFAEAVLVMRERCPGVLLEAARPCETQADSWPEQERQRYNAILERCDFETLIQRHYDPFCMMRRNRYMVDRSKRLIAVYNGVPQGGTAQTITYALRRKLTVDIIDLEEFQ